MKRLYKRKNLRYCRVPALSHGQNFIYRVTSEFGFDPLGYEVVRGGKRSNPVLFRGPIDVYETYEEALSVFRAGIKKKRVVSALCYH